MSQRRQTAKSERRKKDGKSKGDTKSSSGDKSRAGEQRSPKGSDGKHRDRSGSSNSGEGGGEGGEKKKKKRERKADPDRKRKRKESAADGGAEVPPKEKGPSKRERQKEEAEARKKARQAEVRRAGSRWRCSASNCRHPPTPTLTPALLLTGISGRSHHHSHHLSPSFTVRHVHPLPLQLEERKAKREAEAQSKKAKKEADKQARLQTKEEQLQARKAKKEAEAEERRREREAVNKEKGLQLAKKREMEKVIKSARTDLARSNRKRRLLAYDKVLQKFVQEEEEAELSAPIPVSARGGGDGNAGANAGAGVYDAELPASLAKLLAQTGGRTLPSAMDGVMEIWNFLFMFVEPLGLRRVPNPQELFDAIHVLAATPPAPTPALRYAVYDSDLDKMISGAPPEQFLHPSLDPFAIADDAAAKAKVAAGGASGGVGGDSGGGAGGGGSGGGDGGGGGVVDGAGGANDDKMEVDGADEAVEEAGKADDFEGEATFDVSPATVSEQAQHVYDQTAITLVRAVMLELYEYLHLDDLAKGSHTSAEQKVKESVPDEVKVSPEF